MKKSIILAFAAALVLARSAGASPEANGAAATSAIARYTAVLLGASEAPPTGSPLVGFAEISVDTSANAVTFAITVPDVTNATAAHIHKSPIGVPGPVVVPLNAPYTNGFSRGVTAGVDPNLIADILAEPGSYYVNVHTSDFPGGALRGQLMPAPGTAIASCLPDTTTLCLNGGRFKVQTAFQTAAIPAGVGNAIPLTSDTGSFWFFTAGNLELMVKVVDGRAVNGKFWVFSGGLSDVAYTITITDLTTGTVKTYTGEQGHQTALNDTSAF
jgi:hypothetical protein